MANHKSAEKRHRQSLKKRENNRNAKSAVRTAIKKARTAAEKGEATKKDLTKTAESKIAKLATKGIIHKKTAQRLISRINKKANK